MWSRAALFKVQIELPQSDNPLMRRRGVLTAEEAAAVLANRPAARTAMTGAAGEYFVAAELSLRGWLATVTIKNSPGTDILAQKPVTGAMVAIQTKTASFGNKFQLHRKAETPTTARNEWYVLVKLHEERTRPTFYVVPRNIVAGAAYAQHREWLSKSRRDGKPRMDTDKRVMIPAEFSGYEDRWDLLDHPADEAPLLIGAWYAECVRDFGLPNGHPGWPSDDPH
jgi:hypothetical protein